MALTKKVQAGLASAATKLREWLDDRIEEQGTEIAQLYQASRDTLTERLRHIYENFLRDEPSVAKARSTGASTAIQQAIDQTVNTLTEDVGREAISGLKDTLSLSSSALNKTLTKFAGMELEELPVSSQWVLQELTTKVIGGGTYFDRLLHLGEDLKGNLYSTIRQGLISGQDFDTVRDKFHRAFGVENVEEPKFNAYGSVNIYKNEARRQWNLLMGDHAKRMGGVEVWWAKQPFDTESTPGCVARHGMAINALGERPTRHYNCRCTVAVFPGAVDLKMYQAEAEAWLNKMGYTRKAAMLEEAEAWIPAQHPRGAKGQFAAGGGGGGEHLGGGVHASAAQVPEHVREWIRAAGATVNGIQEVPIEGHPGIVLFTDHKTGSTSALSLKPGEVTPEKIKQKIDEKQAALKAQQKKESQVTWGREDLILIGREAAETVQAWDTAPEEALAYRYLAFPWRGLPRAIQAGVPVAAAAPSLLEAYRRADPASVVLRVPFTARSVANPRQVQILARTGWTPMQPADARWIEVEPGAFAADSADPITWDLPAVRLSPDAIERFPAMGGIALRDNGPWQAAILRADDAPLDDAPPPDDPPTRSLPSLVDTLLDAGLPTDPVLAVWDRRGLATTVRLADGRVLYARDAFEGLVPGVYQRVAVYCPQGLKVWAVRPRGHGYWVLPGGHIDDGELKREAAVREMLEETGVPVTITQYVGALHRPWSTTHVFYGLLTGPAGEPTTREEIDAVMPVDFEDLDPAERLWLRSQDLAPVPEPTHA